ncbi:MAG: glycosyltransferase family 39 protein [Anaerolinea sp.]|nr:glycosyltransferase family 39 protein [Anaerolinea sp.]
MNLTPSPALTHRPARSLELWLSVLILLGIVALLMRYFPHDSLWYDEALTTYVATDSWETLWRWCTQVDIQVPFHYAALRLWTGAAGSSEFSLRVLSALCIPLAAAGVIAVGRRLARGTGAGQAAAILLGALPGVLWIAYEVRAYAWGLALYVWACAFLTRILTNRRPSPALILTYGLLMAGALYTHYTALAGFAAHGLIVGGAVVVALSRRVKIGQIIPLIAPLILAGMLFAPWVPTMLARGGTDRSYYRGSIPPLQSIQVAAGFKALGRQDMPPTADALGLAYGALVIAGAVLGLISRRGRAAALWAISLLAVPLAFTVLILIVNPKLTGRYFWTAWIGADVLVALALVTLTRYRLILLLIGATAIAAVPYFTGERGESPDSDFRGVYATICEQGTPDDVILLRDGTLFVTAEYYGKRPPCDSPRRTFGMPEALITDVTRMLTLGEAQGVMAQVAALRPPRVWVIAWQGDVMEPQNLVYGLLDGVGAHTLIGRMFGDVRLDRYDFDTTAHEKLAKVAQQGALEDAQWYNIRPFPDGPNLIALRLIAPEKVKAGDVITVLAWWERGETLYPDLRVSARLTTLDHGWVYAQIDQPPSAWKNVDDRWMPGIPVLGRYELVVGADIPPGLIRVRYVIYDPAGRIDPVVIPVGDIKVIQ